MFTGLVEDVGTIVRAEAGAASRVFAIRPGRIALADIAIGESISHDGVCLTVTAVGSDGYTVLAGEETLVRTNLGDRAVGDRLNLERALRAGDRLGGHMVAGHVDAIGALAARDDRGANVVLAITTPPELLRYIVEKGSIALDGVSLTVNTVDARGFSVAIIPHTLDHTTLGEKAVGARLNLEVDVIAKYVEKLSVAYASRRNE